MVQSCFVKRINQLLSVLRLIFVMMISLIILQGSTFLPKTQLEKIRAFTRQDEFEFVNWTFQALEIKFVQSVLGSSEYLTEKVRRQVVVDYLELQKQISQKETLLSRIFSDPDIDDPQTTSLDIRKNLDEKYKRRAQIGPLAETILQSQISNAIAEMGLSLGGQAVPPVLFKNTPLPLMLNISPRYTIRLDESVALTGDLSVDKQVELEQNVERALNVSALVEDVGGIGLYPTMVGETSDLDWLSEVVSHEWVHNFLTLRPLGLSYDVTPELRVMNETVASIAGKEIGLAVLNRYYPELVPPPAPKTENNPAPEPASPPTFNFNHEMHITRVTVDKLLAEDKIEEAEKYMEERRVVFWEHDYQFIRRLNQAYFAFHGAYADEPGGAAGATEDPVGEAVRLLRSESPSLAAFLNRISWMSSFEQLQQALSS